MVREVTVCWDLDTECQKVGIRHPPPPGAGTIVVEFDAEGFYLQKAEGINEKGKECMERPVRFIPDGKPHPIPDLIGLKYDATKTDPNTMTGEVTKEHGLERFGTKAPYESPTTRTLPP